MEKHNYVDLDVFVGKIDKDCFVKTDGFWLKGVILGRKKSKANLLVYVINKHKFRCKPVKDLVIDLL